MFGMPINFLVVINKIRYKIKDGIPSSAIGTWMLDSFCSNWYT